MKKFTKISLILALALTIVGVGCLGAGILLGGTRQQLGEAFQGGDFSFGDSYDETSDQQDNFNASDNIKEEITGQMQGASYPNVQDISIEMKRGLLYLEVGNTKDVQVAVESIDGKDQTVVKQDGEELEIQNTDMKESGSITLYLPEDYPLNQLNISMGAGEVICQAPVYADSMDVELGAGSFKGSSEIKAKESDWEVDAGELILDNFTGSDMEFQCKAGNVAASIKGTQDDYQYALSCKLGSISIGTEEYNGAMKKELNTKKDKTIQVSCGIGTIKLDFIN